MLLPQTPEYAMRIMAQLARWQGEEPARSADLAETTQVPRAYLSKILRRLVLAELLVSQKGRGGGYVLQRTPEEITYREILEAVGYDFEGTRCAFGWGRCNEARPCVLHRSWSTLNGEFRQWAEANTLAEACRGARLKKPQA